MDKNITSHQSNVPDIQINILQWLNKVAKFWWLFLVTLILSVGASQLYLRYTTFEYVTKSKLLIRGTGSESGISELGVLAGGFDVLSESNKTVNNEIQIITSRPIIQKTIERIKGGVTYVKMGAIKNTELYNETSIILKSFELGEENERLTFYLKIGYFEDFEFRINKDEEGEKYFFDKSFENAFGKFLIQKNDLATFYTGIYQINIMPSEDVAQYYQSRLQIEIVGSEASSNIIELILQDASPKKAVDFISNLIEVYNQADLDDNTQVLTNSINFIDIRLKSVLTELNQIESEIELYKRSNELVGVGSSVGSYVVDELRSRLESLSEYEVQQELLQSLYKYLVDEQNVDKLIPMNVASIDPNLSTFIIDYNRMFLRHKRLTETVTEFSPNLASLSNEMADIKALILITIRNLKNDLDIPISNLESDIQLLKGNIGQVPTMEKRLMEKLRIQSIKEALYLFLLQKREETALSKAVYKANSRIIEPAKSSRGSVYPKKKMVLLASIILGLFVPLIIVSVISIFQTKLESEEVLTSMLTMPILGRLPRFKMKGKTILSENKGSMVLETFRLLRTNLNYLNLNQKQQTILITSPMSGDGKTITAINLAITIARSGKKVVLLDLDMRKPKVTVYLERQNEKGMSNYLLGYSTIEDLIVNHDEVENFSYISSGLIPPNPNEMIMSDRMKDLIKDLKQKYDYVIIDMPPVGLVSDALLLQDQVDSTLFIVRLNHTQKPMLKYAEELFKKKQLANPSIVINDVKSSRTSYAGYNTVYGAGYYHEES
ncbi:MAG: tyrosine-protein kinase Etk/Wzc [Cyclobacteriaceae bacterium]|jgi:capsular exopolysaccharide synthesis family protein